jgi:hypothetical protein
MLCSTSQLGIPIQTGFPNYLAYLSAYGPASGAKRARPLKRSLTNWIPHRSRRKEKLYMYKFIPGSTKRKWNG